MDYLIWALGTLITIIIILFIFIRKQKAKFVPQGEMLKYLVEALCDAAEEWFPEKGKGTDKYNWVMDMVRAECKEDGVKFSPLEVTALIETYVHDVINNLHDTEVAVG